MIELQPKVISHVLQNGYTLLARYSKLGKLWHFGCSHILLIVSPPLCSIMRTEPVFEPSRVKHAGSGDVWIYEYYGGLSPSLIAHGAIRFNLRLRTHRYRVMSRSVEKNWSLVLQFIVHNKQFQESHVSLAQLKLCFGSWKMISLRTASREYGHAIFGLVAVPTREHLLSTFGEYSPLNHKRCLL